MKIKYHPDAKRDQKEAAAWYRTESPAQVSRFFNQRAALLQRIRDTPQQFPFVDEKHQVGLMPVFPYRIIFLHKPEYIVVVAVAHTSRHPSYWRSREI